MNFIHRLKADLATRDIAVNAAQQQIQDFLQFLGTEKFLGVDTDEQRKDWISTRDVVTMLQDLRSTLQGDR
jgi:hypothetical protein